MPLIIQTEGETIFIGNIDTNGVSHDIIYSSCSKRHKGFITAGTGTWEMNGESILFVLHNVSVYSQDPSVIARGSKFMCERFPIKLKHIQLRLIVNPGKGRSGVTILGTADSVQGGSLLLKNAIQTVISHESSGPPFEYDSQGRDILLKQGKGGITEQRGHKEGGSGSPIRDKVNTKTSPVGSKN